MLPFFYKYKYLYDNTWLCYLLLHHNRYYNKDGEALSGPYGNLKKSLCQSRDKVFTPNNKRPSRLKDTLIELEV